MWQNLSVLRLVAKTVSGSVVSATFHSCSLRGCKCEALRRPVRGRATDALSAAFTLIELLTVIAIISILIAIMVPAVATVRAKANAAKCISNLRQIGSGIYAVAADGPPHLPAGYYPPVDYFDNDYKFGAWYLLVAEKMGLTQKSSDSGWTAQLSPNANIFVCPDNPTPKTIQLGPGGSAYGNLSYGYNDAALGSTVTPSGPTWNNNICIAAMTNASKVIMVADSNADGFYDCIVNDWGGKAMWPGNRHQGCAHVLFCDGHVARVPYAKIKWGNVRPNAVGFFVDE